MDLKARRTRSQISSLATTFAMDVEEDEDSESRAHGEGVPVV